MSWLSVLLAELGLLCVCLGGGAAIVRQLGCDERELTLPLVIGIGLTVLGVGGLWLLLLFGAGASGMLVLRTAALGGAALLAMNASRVAAQSVLLAVVLLVLVVFSLRQWVFFTVDSFFLHYVVDLALDRGGLPMSDYGWHFLGHPIWLHVAHVWTNAFGSPYVRWVFPVAFAVTAWVAIATVAREAKGGQRLGIVSPILLMISYQMLIQGQMANHHMMVAMLLLVSGVLLVRDGSLRAGVAAGIMLASVPHMRMEGAMLVGLFAGGMLPVIATPGRAVAVTGLPLALVAPWVVFLAAHRNDGMLSLAQFLGSNAILAVACAGSVVVLSMRHTQAGAVILRNWYRLCGLGVAGLIAAGAAVHPATTLSNLLMIPQNLLIFARWGVFWDLALLVAGALVAARLGGLAVAPSPFACFAAVGALAIGMLFVVGAFREPYRYNWSDSSTRMLVHVAPLVAVWLGERLMALQRMVGELRVVEAGGMSFADTGREGT